MKNGLATQSWGLDQFYTEKYKLMDEAGENGDYETEDGLREEIQPYGVTVMRVMRLELAGGGPAYWLECELDREQWGFSVGRLVFHYSDWFDHAERDLCQSEAPGLWRMAEYYAEIASDV